MVGRKGWWTVSAGTMRNTTSTKKPDEGTLRRAGGRSRVRGQGKGAGFDRFSQVEHTKTVLEIALDEEIADHRGHAKCEKVKAYRAANACNGTAPDRWPSEGAQQQ